MIEPEKNQEPENYPTDTVPRFVDISGRPFPVPKSIYETRKKIQESTKSDNGKIPEDPDLVDFGGKLIPQKKAEELRNFIAETNKKFSEYSVAKWIYFDEKGQVRLKVIGDLKLDECTDLISLPEDFEITGNLRVEVCSNLRELPRGLKVGGNLDVLWCRNLTKINGTLSVEGILNLVECVNLSEISENITVKKGIEISGSEQLTKFPNNITTDNLLILSCRNLKEIGANLKVTKNMELKTLNSLEKLPEHMRVGGTFHLWRCNILSNLPEGLILGSVFSIYGCPGLSILPEDMTVDGTLALENCTGLENFKSIDRIRKLEIEKKFKDLSIKPKEAIRGYYALRGDALALQILQEKFQVLKEDISPEILKTAINIVKIAMDMFDDYRSRFKKEFSSLLAESKKEGSKKDKIQGRAKAIKTLIEAKRSKLLGILNEIFSKDLLAAIKEQTKDKDVIGFVSGIEK